jgi:hypothetical protein
MAPQLSREGASSWKLANCSLQTSGGVTAGRLVVVDAERIVPFSARGASGPPLRPLVWGRQRGHSMTYPLFASYSFQNSAAVLSGRKALLSVTLVFKIT